MLGRQRGMLAVSSTFEWPIGETAEGALIRSPNLHQKQSMMASKEWRETTKPLKRADMMK